MAKFMRKTLLCAKTESTPGSAETLAGTDAYLIRNATLTPLAGSTAERSFVRETWGNYGTIQLDQHIELTFEIEFSPSGAAGTAPPYGDLLLACSMDETVTPATSAAYTLLSTGGDSCTIEVFMDGIKHTLVGCRGNYSLNLSRGALPTLNFTVMGSYAAPADASPYTADFSDWKVPVGPNSLNTATVTLHGIDICMESLSIDLANQLVFRDLPGCDPGALITDRKPSGTIVFQMTDVATYPWVENARLHTVDDFQVVHGITAGNIITINAPAVSFGQPSFTDSDGILMRSMPVVFEPVDGDDELEFVYT